MPESSRLSEISTSTIRRMFEIVARAKREGKDVINLSIGEPDFHTHPLLIEKANKAMAKGYTHYTSNFGLEELRSVIAERYGVNGSNVMVTAGASEALLNASLAFIEEGSRVLIPTPGFLSYFTYAKICRAKIEQIYTHENGFEVNPDYLSETMDRDVSVIFLNYPNNPTGVVMRNLKSIAEIAADYNAVVISDEIYDSIYYDIRPETLAALENTVVINGFSKSLAMTGWRVGYVIANEELLDSMLKVHQVNGVCAPAFAQKAIAELMEDGTDRKITEEMVEEFRRRRDFVFSSLKDMGIKAVKPEGAFYIFPEVPLNSTDFTEKLIEHGVAVTPGTAFGDGNENYIRISYAASMEVLEKAIKRL
ncbi:MAG TPA: aminotransferase class I/II-fold pyridoxal phosphate-dependent enzyme, partial [Archaeoglobaceae archaeon]|nr:aminotransferase class I/II-fold pyridoxal phosphate-dependent enzyme [Archaeoglobaceae archaeon]